jgi:tetratricopeptide (TPR) repeat protein
MKILLLTSLTTISLYSYSQPNCNVYLYNKDEPCYKACVLATEGEGRQGSKESQLKFDSAIKLCSDFAYAYREKSVPYLKRGDFITWKKLIDKAVEINPMENLGYRGWCRFQFVRDYQGAIADLEKLDAMTDFEIGYSVNGDYQLNIAKALCYKAIGQKEKAIEIIEKQLSEKNYSTGLYDYFHLGVLKMETGETEKAISILKKSISTNDYFAEPYYYLALIYKKQKLVKEFKENMEKAKTYYLKGYKRFDPYTQPMDKIYLADIERELKE